MMSVSFGALGRETPTQYLSEWVRLKVPSDA